MTSPARIVTAFLVIAAVGLSLALPFTTTPTAAADEAKDVKRLKKQMAVAVKQADASKVLSIFKECKDVGAATAEVIVAGVVGVESKRTYNKGLKTLVDFGGEALAPVFDEMLGKKKTPHLHLSVIMMVAAQLDDPRSEDWIIAGLGHKLRPVRSAAVEAARFRKSKKAIPHIIEIIGEKNVKLTKLNYDARLALIALTGRDFADVEDWRNFWEGNKDSLDPKKLEGEGKTQVKLEDPDLPKFFGVEVVSDRICFVIDISGSMQKWDEGGEEGGKGSSWEVRQRIRRTQVQLSNAIRKLSGKARFNVVAFNDKATTLFKKGLSPASGGNKGKAMKWVKKLAADRGTDTGLALREAFKDPNVDTIVLLTDGAPHTQQGTPDKLIPLVEEELKDLNRLRKVRIFTFGFTGHGEWPPGSRYAGTPGADPDPDMLTRFLKGIAKENNGEYKRID